MNDNRQIAGMSLVPQARLGALLSARRKDTGLSLAQVADESNGIFSPEDLKKFELGRGKLDDKTVFQLSAVYELDAGPVVPARARLIVDLDKGIIDSGNSSTTTAVTDRSEILERYLALVYTMRGIKPGQHITLRRDDVGVLAEALVTSAKDIEDELVLLMGSAKVARRTRRLSKRVSIPVVGLLVGFTAIGSLVLAPGAGAEFEGTSIANMALEAADEIQQTKPDTDTQLVMPVSSYLSQDKLDAREAQAKKAESDTSLQRRDSDIERATPEGTGAKQTDREQLRGSPTTTSLPTESTPSTSPSTEPQPAPTTLPAPPAPTTTAVASTTTTVRTPATVGAEAEAMIKYDWKSKSKGWKVEYQGNRPGYRGMTNRATKTVTIYVRSNDSAAEVAGVLAHELGHVLDLEYMDNEKRLQWLDAREMPHTWWVGDGKPDFAVGQGDFAEAVAKVLVNSPSDSLHGEFSEAELNLARQMMP